MTKELSFRNLPFEPVNGQVIYVERTYNEKLNKFIRHNYEWLRTTFRSQGLQFCFLPLLAEETIAYNAPYLTSEELDKQIRKVPSLAEYLADNEVDIVPCLVFALDIPIVDKDGNTVLQVRPIQTQQYIDIESTFADLASEISTISNKEREECRFSIGVAEPDSGYRSTKKTEEADNNFDIQSQLLIDEIKQRIEALRNRGVNTMFLHNLIDEGERLSRLRITKDFRIFLIDYDNLEIKLSVLPKSVFILFLRHPEGIRFKELADYYHELLQIYQKMNPIGGRQKQEQSIRDITDPFSNSINEKCARIREAFVSNFDDRLAKNYYVTGKRGEAKRIILDESMIIWEE